MGRPDRARCRDPQRRRADQRGAAGDGGTAPGEPQAPRRCGDLEAGRGYLRDGDPVNVHAAPVNRGRLWVPWPPAEDSSRRRAPARGGPEPLPGRSGGPDAPIGRHGPAVSRRFCRCSTGVLPWPAAGGLDSIVRIDRRPSASLGKEHVFRSGDGDGVDPGHPAMLAVSARVASSQKEMRNGHGPRAA